MYSTPTLMHHHVVVNISIHRNRPSNRFTRALQSSVDISISFLPLVFDPLCLGHPVVYRRLSGVVCISYGGFFYSINISMTLWRMAIPRPMADGDPLFGKPV